ncbi:MAG: hypothetical protein ABGX04_15525 [Myxococcales bacterium]|nr:hypothetical protein [Myxococcales bacterium]HIL80725.1 hypothetical protein [Myxococcales bacterium]
MEQRILFPSSDWFQKLAICMLAQEDEYRRLGPMDCTMVVRVSSPENGDRNFEIVFRAFSVDSVREINDPGDVPPEHFIIEASLQTWQEMIENIREHCGPDLKHTLNFLTFPNDPMRVNGPDQLQTDAFYRYNRSIQQFFNGATDVPTIYN